jgi:fucose 4-O-acetylase-like acetyltransferase
MPVLIVLTAFFFRFSKSPALIFKNAVRFVLFPYFIFEAIYVLMHFSANHFGLLSTNTPPIGSIQELLEVFFYKPTGPFWFLYYLAIVQISLSFFIYLFRVFHVEDKVLLSCLLLLVVSAITPVSSGFGIFYVLGLLLALLNPSLNVNIIFMVFIISICGLFGGYSAEDDYFLRIPFVFSVLFGLVWIGSRFRESFVCKVFVYLGQNSMVILCWHAFVIVIFRPLSEVFLYVDPSGILYSVIVTVAGCLISLVITWITDAIGISKYLFGKGTALREYS